MSLNRRTVLKGALATSVATSALKVPAAVAQNPIKRRLPDRQDRRARFGRAADGTGHG